MEQEKQIKKLAKETLKNLKTLAKFYYGRECEDHEEECVVCSAYMVLKEFKRLYMDQKSGLTLLPVQKIMEDYKYVVYATTNHGDGYVTKIGNYEDLEDIEVRVGTFSPDVVITIEKKYEKTTR